METDHTAHAQSRAVDELDGRLVSALAEHPRAGILEISRLLGVARNTVYARLERLQRTGVITGFGPDIDLAKIGFDVVAFTTIEVTQGRFSDVVAVLETMPQVIEVHTIAGVGDLMCRVVARTNEGIMDIVQLILEIPGVDRTNTAISLAHPIPSRSRHLLLTTARQTPPIP